MLKISVIDSPRQRTLVVEGALVAPWASELVSACEMARVGLDGRELLVELKNLIAISADGEDVLVALMTSDIKLRSQGVFTKRLLTEIARKARGKPRERIVR